MQTSVLCAFGLLLACLSAKSANFDGLPNLNGNTNHDTRYIPDIQIHYLVSEYAQFQAFYQLYKKPIFICSALTLSVSTLRPFKLVSSCEASFKANISVSLSENSLIYRCHSWNLGVRKLLSATVSLRWINLFRSSSAVELRPQAGSILERKHDTRHDPTSVPWRCGVLRLAKDRSVTARQKHLTNNRSGTRRLGP